MPKKLTHEQFCEKVEKIYDKEYEIKGIYIDNKTPILVLHTICGNKYSPEPRNLLSGKGCRICGHKRAGVKRGVKKKKTNEKFLQQVFDATEGEYKVLSEYKGTHDYVLMKHDIESCGYTWDVECNAFLKGSRCPKCNGKYQRTPEEFKQEVYDLVGEEYIFLEEYAGYNVKIKCKHNKYDCDYKWNVAPSNFLMGSRCPKCQGCARKDTDIFKQEVFNLVGNEYLVLSEYINSNEKILMKHNIENCNCEYPVAPSKFLIGRRCPSCSESSNEVAIRMFLQQHNINFEAQYKFDDCKNILSLPFDFAIFNDKLNLKYLIEFDGEQHYRPVTFGGMPEEEAVKNYKSTKRNDKIKNKYCEKNNIVLVRIPYWEARNINQILRDLLLI